MLPELVQKTRSFRRFMPEPAPTLNQLEDLVALTRFTASASNKQPLKYILVQNPPSRQQVFSCLKWAGYLPDWSGPTANEQPTAYIIILSDPTLNERPQIDVGIAAQTMLLAGRELGFGGCLLASVDQPRLRELLKIPAELEIQLVLAMGAPGEQVEITLAEPEGDIRYWRDQQDIHRVPKRSAQELVVGKH